MTEMKIVGGLAVLPGLLFIAVAFGVDRPASALPAFAQQTGQP